MDSTLPETSEKKEEFLDSLANGLQLLRIYATGVASVTVQEAAEQLDVTRAASRRILLTLEKLGYVRQDGRQFSPTPRSWTWDMPIRVAEPAQAGAAGDAGRGARLG